MGNEATGDKGVKKSLGDQKDDQGRTDVGRFEGEDQHGFSPDVGEASEQAREAGDKAFAGKDTQRSSTSEEGAVYAPDPAAEKVGESVTEGGEERGAKKSEPGRVMDESDTGEKDAGGEARPAGKSTARFSTGVAPERSEAQDEESPHLPSGDQGG
jgi:hypothetical protein